jgi:hypothetical protein
VASDINGDTVVTLGSDNDATGTITLKGVSDSSSLLLILQQTQPMPDHLQLIYQAEVLQVRQSVRFLSIP